MLSFREKFRMVDVRSWMFLFSIGKFGRCHIDEIKRNFSILTFSEIYNSFTFGMDSLILAYNHILSWLPFEPSLPCYNVSRHDFFTSKLLQSMIILLSDTPISFQLNLDYFEWKKLASWTHRILLQSLMDCK